MQQSGCFFVCTRTNTIQLMDFCNKRERINEADLKINIAKTALAITRDTNIKGPVKENNMTRSQKKVNGEIRSVSGDAGKLKALKMLTCQVRFRACFMRQNCHPTCCDIGLFSVVIQQIDMQDSSCCRTFKKCFCKMHFGNFFRA